MKHASLLIALIALFSLSATAQSAAPEDNKTQRITITTKKTDDNGKTITETWIAEGDHPDQILQEMAIDPGVMQQIDVDIDMETEGEERLFLIRSAGDNVLIEGTLDENVDADEQERIVIIAKNVEIKDDQDVKRVYTWTSDNARPHGVFYSHNGRQESNCAALGVYANNRSDEYGATINRIIDGSGAQAAGLKEGDVIKKIEEFDVSDFPSLHFALSNFLPGDKVNVDYMRDGKYMHATATLKNWAEIPGHEYRSRTDCSEPEPPVDTARDEPEGPTGLHQLQTLELSDARIYPNPNDGVFSLSFTPQPGPVSVTISDVNGKVVYEDQRLDGTGFYTSDINISDVPTGNYIISVTQDGKIFTHQISKQ